MGKLTRDEVYAFIEATGPGGMARTAKLATVRADGAPHVAPVWVAVDGEDILFTTDAGTLKGKALARDPRVALSFDDETPPYAFAIVEGTVTISEDPEELLRWATVIGGRYMGAAEADRYGRRNAVPGELLVRVHPTKVFGARDVAS